MGSSFHFPPVAFYTYLDAKKERDAALKQNRGSAVLEVGGGEDEGGDEAQAGDGRGGHLARDVGVLQLAADDGVVCGREIALKQRVLDQGDGEIDAGVLAGHGGF